MVQVDVLDSQDAVNLELLTRPDLGVTFTKLHCWRLTQFTKCVFMDADTMVNGKWFVVNVNAIAMNEIITRMIEENFI